MTKKTVHKELSLKTRGLLMLALVFIASFLAPRPAAAQISGASAPTTSNSGCPGGESCESPGTAMSVAGSLMTDFNIQMITASITLEKFLHKSVNDMLQEEYDEVNWLERSMDDWWNTMWSYNLLPDLQAMTRQLNIDLALQTLGLQSYADASTVIDVKRAMDKHAAEDHAQLYPGEQVCVAATTGGAYTRASVFSRAMREAWENDSDAAGLNTAGTTGATSAASTYGQNYQDYINIFCDPNGNSGKNNCGASDSLLYNADVEPVKYIYNNLTINVNDAAEGPHLAKTVETIVNNMIGLPAADPLLVNTLSSTTGEKTWLDRRAYMARYGAIRSVPDMVAGWRMPGSQMSQWIAALRESAGVSAQTLEGSSSASFVDGISKDPSYKEVMHAVSVDRFNSGTYALGMITDDNKIEMERLNLSVFYLMQLRDYYELLERTALTLAVQVSVISEEKSLPGVHSSMPMK